MELFKPKIGDEAGLIVQEQQPRNLNWRIVIDVRPGQIKLEGDPLTWYSYDNYDFKRNGFLVYYKPNKYLS